MSTAITNLQVDPPVQINSYGSRDDRRYIDDQIRAVEQHLVTSLLTGVHCTWMEVDGTSATINSPTCVAAIGVSGTGGVTVIPATSTNAPYIVGIALTSGAPGTKILVALAGALPATITGIVNSFTTGYAKVDTTTGLPVFAASVTVGTDIILGRVNTLGITVLDITTF